MKDFLNLRIGQIIKDEATFDKYYNNSIKRFIQWNPQNSDSEIGLKFNRCIELTHLSYEISKNLLTRIKSLRNNYQSRTPAEIVKEQAIQFAKLYEPLSMGVDVKIIERTKKLNKKAEELLIKAIEENASFKDETLDKYINTQLGGHGSFEISMVKQYFIPLYYAYNTEMRKIETNEYLIYWTGILRGFLFAGIFKIEGEKLENKIFKDDIKKIGMEIAGSIIPIGLINSFIKLLEDFHSYETEPDMVEKAEFLVNYLNKYEQLLLQWNIMANSTSEMLEKSCNNIYRKRKI